MGLFNSIRERRELRGDIKANVEKTDSIVLGRRYVGPTGRQTHLLEGGPVLEGGAKPHEAPLWCLHATAYSGRSFTPFLESLAARRRVVAADTCGYGGSDGPGEQLDIGGYALRIVEALDAAGEGQVDLLGYHTGALIAGELARRLPDRIGRLVLVGIPCLTGVEQQEWRRRLAAPTSLSEDLAQFQERWDFLVAGRDARVPLGRAFDNFVDELRAYPDGWRAHEAAFTFDVEDCFVQITQPTLILNPDNHLSAPSRRAAAMLSTGRLVELPHLNNGIFDVAHAELASLVEAFLRERAKETDAGVRARFA